MDSREAPELSFKDIETLIKGAGIADGKVIDAVGNLIGAAIVLAPVAIGPAALPLLAVLEAKNEMVELAKLAASKIVGKSANFLERTRAYTAAHFLLTYTAFFEAIATSIPEVAKAAKLSATERQLLTNRAAENLDAIEGPSDSASTEQTVLNKLLTLTPHPTWSIEEEKLIRKSFYAELTKTLTEFLRNLSVWERLTLQQQRDATQSLSSLPDVAVEMWHAQYLALMLESRDFFTWVWYCENSKLRSEVAKQSADLKKELSLVADTMGDIDLGLKKFSAAIPFTISQKREVDQDVEEVLRDLGATYSYSVNEPIIKDEFEEPGDRTTLQYPSKIDAFVPQAFKALRYTGNQITLEDEALWTQRPKLDDLGSFILRFLESRFSTDSILLALGHPGSGKSLLTEVLAARLARPCYNTIRVELRDIDPDSGIQAQIEEQIRRDTGRDISWAAFSAHLRENPPLVILDGYDELLQASGKVFGGYLEEVRKFQRREAVLKRPVRIMVTSRITLIDKASIPHGTSVVRLLEFDAVRRERWIKVWNAINADYYREKGVAPFQVGTDPQVIQLAEQPLLLLMLALYDSDSNQLKNSSIQQTLLYYNLLCRFIERERSKGDAGSVFRSLTKAEQEDQIDKDVMRLGVAAIGMYNRRTLHIRRQELDRDISYFKMERDAIAGSGSRLSQADLLLGSFFFIHESRSKSGDPHDMSGNATAFEFLHNTFGEFLAADFILRQITKVTREISALRDNELFADTLAMKLEALDPHWFACLSFTALHTRPVILQMLREWSTHYVGSEDGALERLSDNLTLILERQIRETLVADGPAWFSSSSRGTPFGPLPLLGHLATYSLNLILLRSVLSGNGYVFDESSMNENYESSRPWDRLRHLWQSWFPVNGIIGVSAIFHAQRAGAKVILSPHDSFVMPPRSSVIDDLLVTGWTLGDGVLQGLMALQSFDFHGAPSAVVDMKTASDGLQEEGAHFGTEFAIKAARKDVDILRRDAALAAHLLDMNGSLNRFTGMPSHVLDGLELIRFRGLSASAVDGYLDRAGPDDVSQFGKLSPYEAAVLFDVKASLDPRWIEDVVDQLRNISMESILRQTFAASFFRMIRIHAGGLSHIIQRRAAWQTVQSNATPYDLETAIEYLLTVCTFRVRGAMRGAVEILRRQLFDGAEHLLDVSLPTLEELADAVNDRVDLSRLREGLFARHLLPIGRNPETRTLGLRHAIALCRLGGTYFPAESRQKVLDFGLRRERLGISRPGFSRPVTFGIVRLARETRDPGIITPDFAHHIDSISTWTAEFKQPLRGLLDCVCPTETMALGLTARQLDDFRWLATELGDTTAMAALNLDRIVARLHRGHGPARKRLKGDGRSGS